MLRKSRAMRAANFGERPGQLDAGGTRTDHDEGQPFRAVARRALGDLIGQKNAAANSSASSRVFNPEHPAPRRHDQVGMRCAGGDDQIVVVELAIFEDDPFLRDVDALRFGIKHGDILLAVEDAANRRGDVTRVERCRGHLIE